uniref:EfeO-type cupredoxin-like domain-containing protein n=1 Tax=candidate division WWE3 bacterium TaxID=2053526 RepID=A0A831Z2D1_UNCKA
MKLKILAPIIILGLAGVFGVWWYITGVLPGREAGDTSGMPVPGEKGGPETIGGEGVTEVKIAGDEYSFTPATITVEKGKTVRLTFKNTGNVSHTWTIDELNADSGLVSPGASKTVEFDAGKAGTYKIYCAVPGHEESGMVGTLEVE